MRGKKTTLIYGGTGTPFAPVVACLSLLFELGLGCAAADHPIVSTRYIGILVLPSAVPKKELFRSRGCR
jgi:hypothetical protein